MTRELLGWWPVLWTARFVLLILLLGCGWCAILYFLRFCRKKHIKGMWNAPMPRLRKFGGTVAGNEFALEIDQGQDEHLAALERRTSELEAVRAVDREAIEEIVRYLVREEGQYEFFNREPGPPG